MIKILKKYALHIAFVQAIIATLSSLYLNEILHFTPCVLCWYQRICMYPLVAILGVGLYRRDKSVYMYVLPLTIIGGSISLFHYLLQKGIIPDQVAPCVAGVSCTTKYLEWFGIITIPFLALTGFVVITACMLLYRKAHKNK